MPPSWLTGKTNELDITKQSESRPANGGRLAKNLWSKLTLTRRGEAFDRNELVCGMAHAVSAKGTNNTGIFGYIWWGK